MSLSRLVGSQFTRPTSASSGRSSPRVRRQDGHTTPSNASPTSKGRWQHQQGTTTLEMAGCKGMSISAIYADLQVLAIRYGPTCNVAVKDAMHTNPRALNLLLPDPIEPVCGVASWLWYCHACGAEGKLAGDVPLGSGVDTARRQHACGCGGESQVIAWRE